MSGVIACMQSQDWLWRKLKSCNLMIDLLFNALNSVKKMISANGFCQRNAR